MVQEVLSAIRRCPLLGGYHKVTLFNETIMTSNTQIIYDELNTCSQTDYLPQIDIIVTVENASGLSSHDSE